MSPVPIYTPGWRETTWSKVSDPRKQHNGRDQAQTTTLRVKVWSAMCWPLDHHASTFCDQCCLFVCLENEISLIFLVLILSTLGSEKFSGFVHVVWLQNWTISIPNSYFRFLEAIERSKDYASYYFLLGKLYWEMNGNLRADKKKCLAQFLKVTVLQPFHPSHFQLVQSLHSFQSF